jgi:DNA-binding IscR family transcriptional regulator
MRANDIAADIAVAPAETAKVLQLLAWAGFVDSRRGTQGGFWLRVPPQQIRVGDVLEFFEKHSRAAAAPEDEVMRSLRILSTSCRNKFNSITMEQLASKTHWTRSKANALTGGTTQKQPH